MSFDVRFEFGIKQKMRDGTRLSADIYRPDAEEKFPVILTRSPYMTVGGFQRRVSEEAKFFARNGYVFVVQDCRGKNDSEGVFHPFFDDPTDGFDTLSWCAKQEWSNGELGTVGASYQAWNQWATAALNPPNLRTMVSIVALPDPVLNVPFQNGAMVLWMAEWMAIVEGRRNTDQSIYDSKSLFGHLPLRSMDEVFGRKSQIWQNWIDHPSTDSYWKEVFYQNKYSAMNVPVLHVSGWYDDDLVGTHLNYVGMTTENPRENVRNNQKLIIGPWQHHVNISRKLAGIDFGEDALIDLRRIELNWFNRWLKGIENNAENELPVEIFIMGANIWRKEKEWPLARTSYVPYFLHSNGNANSASGDGTLDASPPASENPDTYTYDPNDPCPNIYDGNQVPAEGPFDQRPIESRNDVLVYTSPILNKPVEVTGCVRMILSASTSAFDTDFWVQLTDVHPDGYSMHLTEGIIRGRYRNSLEKPQFLNPGVVYEFPMDLWIISNCFLKGHRMRVDVSSSSFPKYDRNPNTGHKFGEDAELVKATQTIHHDRDNASRIILPIIG